MKKSRIGMIIILAVVAVILISGTVWFMVNKNRNDDTKNTTTKTTTQTQSSNKLSANTQSQSTSSSATSGLQTVDISGSLGNPKLTVQYDPNNWKLSQRVVNEDSGVTNVVSLSNGKYTLYLSYSDHWNVEEQSTCTGGVVGSDDTVGSIQLTQTPNPNFYLLEQVQDIGVYQGVGTYYVEMYLIGTQTDPQSNTNLLSRLQSQQSGASSICGTDQWYYNNMDTNGKQRSLSAGINFEVYSSGDLESAMNSSQYQDMRDILLSIREN